VYLVLITKNKRTMDISLGILSTRNDVSRWVEGTMIKFKKTKSILFY
jgi:hypothetical protein